MNVSPRRIAIPLLALIVSFGLLATACGGAEDSADSGSSTTGKSSGQFDYSGLSGALDGGGSSFQDALQQAVKVSFAKAAPGLTVNYTKSGSGQGKQNLADQTIDFAGTDSLVKDEEKANFKGGDFLYFPIAAAPITLTVNLPDVTTLDLDADTIAGIFGGSITTWSDPAIAALNKNVKLPGMEIVPVHRSDKSGTTSNFTKYLTAAAPSVWTFGAADEIQWPTPTSAEKNSGVSSIVASTEGAIGYIDLADAVAAQEKTPALAFALVKNKAGKFVAPLLPGATAAIEGSELKDDLTFNPLNADGDAAYPITAPTWILTYAKYADAATSKAIKGYLHFFLTDGQKLAEGNGYAPLPASFAEKALAQVDEVS